MSESKTLLIVEDESALREELANRLEMEGYQVLTADTAEEGAKLFKKSSVDLVILDIMLPKKSGFEFLRAIRRGKKHSDVPVIIHTVRVEYDDILKGYDLGATIYLRKPLDVKAIPPHIKNLLFGNRHSFNSEPSGVKTVLVIDDEPIIRESVAHRMNRDGYRALLADSAEEGMRLFRRESPDLVILDIMLPGRSGFDFLRVVRRNEETRDLPVIMLSAMAQEDDFLKGYDLGATLYFRKPFYLTELSYNIKRIFAGIPRQDYSDVLFGEA